MFKMIPPAPVPCQGSGPATADKSCGTCRDRRISCDRAVPICTQCSQSKRHCKGYGLRLSWPNASNRRRAVVARPFFSRNKRSDWPKTHLITVSSWDIEMHYYMTSSVPHKYARPILQMPVLWNPLTLKDADKDLFQYFQLTASQSLTTFGHDPTKVGNILIRVAVAGDTPSSKAVLKSLLALSSLHRYGVQAQAIELKISALAALAAASESNIGAKEAIQHIAAGLLLCSFEIHQSSFASSQWTWYIRGVKEVIYKINLRRYWRDSEFTTLADWMYYQDVLARFSLRHWHGATGAEIPKSPPDMCTEAALQAPSTFAILRLLSEVCDTVSTRPPDIASIDEYKGYKGFLQVLDWRIRNVPVPAAAGNGSEPASVVELYQLALLVYLHRLSGKVLDEPVRTQQRVDKAFAIFPQMESCERQFPVFVLGCEARTDEQRAVILDLIARTEKNVSSRSFLYVRLMLQAVWAQDDLADRELQYWDKLSSIISCASILPTFV
ncbi:fungal-specific transcription factor domain-containing protein [Hypoxylon sp. FL1150]|nr:fungal-specific transcription factor domain-containing protein [Hypoxylon sp. FL1150]